MKKDPSSLYGSLFKKMGHDLYSPKYYDVIKTKYNHTPYVMDIIQPPDKPNARKSILIAYKTGYIIRSTNSHGEKAKAAMLKRNKSASVIKKSLSDMMILNQLVNEKEVITKHDKHFLKIDDISDINTELIRGNRTSCNSNNNKRSKWNITGLNYHSSNNSKTIDNDDHNAVNDNLIKSTKKKRIIPISLIKKPKIFESRNRSNKISNDTTRLHHKQPKIVLNDLYSKSVLQFQRDPNSIIHKKPYRSIKSKVTTLINEPFSTTARNNPRSFSFRHNKSCSMIEKDSQCNNDIIIENMINFNDKNDLLKERLSALVDDYNVEVRVHDTIKQAENNSTIVHRYIKGINFNIFKEKFYLISTINPGLAYKQRIKLANQFDLKKGDKIDIKISKWDDDPLDPYG